MTAIDLPTADEAAEPVEPAIDEVEKLLAEGREQGYLTGEHIAEVLEDVELTSEQIESLFSRLADEGIEILEGDETAAVDATDADAEEAAAAARPVAQDTEQRPGPHVSQGDRQGAAAHGRRRGLAGPPHRAPRHGGQAQADRSQPAPRRVDRQALRGPRHAVPRPNPGGQPRPDPRGREVRLPQGLQVLDLRHLVDPPGDLASRGRPESHDPRARAHGRDRSTR